MKRIGIISDTHGFLDDAVFSHFENCDEIWHAGDFGNGEITEKLASFRPLKAVYGNIDGKEIRNIYPEKLFFYCENIPVYIQHIGGYPGKYAPGVKQEIISQKAKLFISGHSHILKIMYDDKLGCLHINPGAAGKQGWHTKRTMVRLVIDDENMKDCEVIELGTR